MLAMMIYVCETRSSGSKAFHIYDEETQAYENKIQNTTKDTHKGEHPDLVLEQKSHCNLACHDLKVLGLDFLSS